MVEVIIPIVKNLTTQSKLDSLNIVDGLHRYTHHEKDITPDFDVKTIYSKEYKEGIDQRHTFNLESVRSTNDKLIQATSVSQSLDVYYANNSGMSFPSNLKSFRERNK